MLIEKGINKLARDNRRVVCRLIKITPVSNAAFAVPREEKDEVLHVSLIGKSKPNAPKPATRLQPSL